MPFINLKTTDTLRHVVILFRKYDRNIFPVLGEEKELLGMVMLNDIRDKMFDETNSWNLPVIKDGKFVGIISKSRLYNEYRKLMLHLSDD